jgi:hypothetical protein
VASSPKLTQEQRIESMRFFRSTIDAAALAGHVLGDELDRVKVTKTGYGYGCTCSCGWTGTAKTKKFAAFREGFAHLGDVLGMDVRSKVRQSLQPVSRAV